MGRYKAQHAAEKPRRRLKKEKPQKSPLKRLWNILTSVFVALALLLTVALVGVRLFGFTPYAVLSASMTPQYSPGDLVYVHETEPEDIQVGDVITFVANEDLTLVTHRVAEIDAENGRVYTKGDANETRDVSPVLYENIVGVVKFSLPKLGYVSNFFTSASGRYIGLAVLFTLILLMILPELFKKEQKKEPAETGTGSNPPFDPGANPPTEEETKG